MDVKIAIEKRRAFRALIPFKISDEILHELGRAAQLAPSCFNNQPWRYVFIFEPQKLNTIKSVFPEQNGWAENASLIIAVISEASSDCQMKDGRQYFLYDAGIASGLMMLRATELDLVAHPMAGYDQNKAKEILDIPNEMTLINIIAVGKHDGNYKQSLDADGISSEENRPARKNLSEFIFINSYGNPLEIGDR